MISILIDAKNETMSIIDSDDIFDYVNIDSCAAQNQKVNILKIYKWSHKVFG